MMTDDELFEMFAETQFYKGTKPALRAIRDAGVVEGIRRAREAVEAVVSAAAADWSPTRDGSRDALDAIDALGATP